MLSPREAPNVLAARRRQILAAKWRFNRALRRIVSWPAAISIAGAMAGVMPTAFEALIRYAGDSEA